MEVSYREWFRVKVSCVNSRDLEPFSCRLETQWHFLPILDQVLEPLDWCLFLLPASDIFIHSVELVARDAVLIFTKYDAKIWIYGIMGNVGSHQISTLSVHLYLLGCRK